MFLELANTLMLLLREMLGEKELILQMLKKTFLSVSFNSLTVCIHALTRNLNLGRDGAGVSLSL